MALKLDNTGNTYWGTVSFDSIGKSIAPKNFHHERAGIINPPFHYLTETFLIDLIFSCQWRDSSNFCHTVIYPWSQCLYKQDSWSKTSHYQSSQDQECPKKFHWGILMKGKLWCYMICKRYDILSCKTTTEAPSTHENVVLFIANMI